MKNAKKKCMCQIFLTEAVIEDVIYVLMIFQLSIQIVYVILHDKLKHKKYYCHGKNIFAT